MDTLPEYIADGPCERQLRWNFWKCFGNYGSRLCSGATVTLRGGDFILCRAVFLCAFSSVSNARAERPMNFPFVCVPSSAVIPNADEYSFVHGTFPRSVIFVRERGSSSMWNRAIAGAGEGFLYANLELKTWQFEHSAFIFGQFLTRHRNSLNCCAEHNATVIGRYLTSKYDEKIPIAAANRGSCNSVQRTRW